MTLLGPNGVSWWVVIGLAVVLAILLAVALYA
jgi:hypothetical protein